MLQKGSGRTNIDDLSRECKQALLAVIASKNLIIVSTMHREMRSLQIFLDITVPDVTREQQGEYSHKAFLVDLKEEDEHVNVGWIWIQRGQSK
jgi:hypothetical protein